MRQFDTLFRKLKTAEQHQQTEHARGTQRVSRKLAHVSVTLSETAQKLDQLAGDFDARSADVTTVHAA